MLHDDACYYDDETCYSMIDNSMMIMPCDDDVHYMMLMHPYTLRCTLYDVDASYTLWCTNYDDNAWYDVMTHSYALWCTLDDDDAYPMMMMHTLWWRCYLMIHYDDACLMFSESTVELLVQWLMRCTMMYMNSV